MILPIIGLLLSITQAGLPTALFTLTSSDKKVNYLISCLKLTIFQFILCLIFILIFKKSISIINPYQSTILIFTFIASLSALFRSIHLGKQNAPITAIAQIIEETVRITTIYIDYQLTKTITLNNLFHAMLLGEFSSCLYMYFKLDKVSFKHKSGFYYKDILSISLPVSLSQIIHSLTHFFEPLLFQYFLLKQNYSLIQIQESYGIITGQVLSLLMIPTFLNSTIYKLLLPKIKDSKNKVKLFNKATLLCLLIGLPFSIIFFFFPDFCLEFLYKNNTGSIYLRYISIPFLIFYMQTPISAFLQAYKKQAILLRNSIIESIVSLSLLIILIPSYHETSLLISYLSGLVIYTTLSFISIIKLLFFNKE